MAALAEKSMMGLLRNERIVSGRRKVRAETGQLALRPPMGRP